MDREPFRVTRVYDRTHLELKTGSDRHRAEAELRRVNQCLSPPPPDWTEGTLSWEAPLVGPDGAAGADGRTGQKRRADVEEGTAAPTAPELRSTGSPPVPVSSDEQPRHK